MATAMLTTYTGSRLPDNISRAMGVKQWYSNCRSLVTESPGVAKKAMHLSTEIPWKHFYLVIPWEVLENSKDSPIFIYLRVFKVH